MTESLETGVGQDAIPGMQLLMTEIVRALVDEPTAVQVEAIPDNDVTVLRLRVASSDIGKVIGKQGRTARSLRTILGAASMKFRHRFALDIVEAEGVRTSHSDSD